MPKRTPIDPQAVAKMLRLMAVGTAKLQEASKAQAARVALAARCVAISEGQQWQETVARYMTFRKERRTNYGEEI